MLAHPLQHLIMLLNPCSHKTHNLTSWDASSVLIMPVIIVYLKWAQLKHHWNLSTAHTIAKHSLTCLCPTYTHSSKTEKYIYFFISESPKTPLLFSSMIHYIRGKYDHPNHCDLLGTSDIFQALECYSYGSLMSPVSFIKPCMHSTQFIANAAMRVMPSSIVLSPLYIIILVLWYVCSIVLCSIGATMTCKSNKCH